MTWIIAAFIFGWLFGEIVHAIRIRLRTIGNLRIDQSDPSEQPYLFLELSEGVHMITDKKIVHLRVRRENFLSQK